MGLMGVAVRVEEQDGGGALDPILITSVADPILITAPARVLYERFAFTPYT